MTQSRNSGGNALDAAYGNPALLGTYRLPSSAISLIPTSVAFWSDKLAISPVNPYLPYALFGGRRDLSMWITSVIDESFGIWNLNPDEVSEKLTKELRGGVSVYAGMRTSPFVYATTGFAFNMRSMTDIEIKAPEGMLLPVFSGTNGILSGETHNFSDFSIEGIWATEVAVKLGFSTTVPVFRNLLNLDKAAAGVGFKYILGHSYFEMKADSECENILFYDPETNMYVVDARFKVRNAGNTVSNNWQFNNPFAGRLINGQGLGLDLGSVFYNSSHSFSFDVQNIGFIFWGKNVSKSNFSFKKEGFDIVDIMEKEVDEIFDRTKGESFPNNDDTLERVKSFLTYLPMAANIGYTYYYDLSSKGNIRDAVQYLSAGVNYEQQIVKGPGRSGYTPRFTFGAAAGFFDGAVPVRAGIILGGSEKIASALGIGFDFTKFSLDGSYKAVGSPYFSPRRGMELAGAVTFMWGRKPNVFNAVYDEEEEDFNVPKLESKEESEGR
jgi:hypothetical protein